MSKTLACWTCDREDRTLRLISECQDIWKCEDCATRAKPDTTREDFYLEIETLDRVHVGVSLGDSHDEDSCMLQIANDQQSLAVAYLSLEQTKELSDALLRFLAAPEGAETR